MNTKRWMIVLIGIFLAIICMACAKASGPAVEATAVPAAETTATPEPATPTPMIVPTPTIAPTPTYTPEATPEPTPAPTETPEPTPTPDPILVQLAAGGQTESEFLAKTGQYAVLPDAATEAVFSAADATVLYVAEDGVLSLPLTEQPSIQPVSSQNQAADGFPVLTVDYQNLKATLSWTPLDWAEGYIVYRKINTTGKLVQLAKLSANQTEYTDVYYKTMTRDKERSLLTATNFIDPSLNCLIYSVRAIATKKDGVKVYSDYMEYFTLPEPAVVSVDLGQEKALIQWARVPLAEGYTIYEGYQSEDGAFHWKRVGQASQDTTSRLEMIVPWDESLPFFTVEAYAYRNGQKVFSEHEETFRVDQRRYAGKNILFLGDSITFGSPYKAASTAPLVGTVDYFSYPNRVAQLTGVTFYNPSIPGSTYTARASASRDRIVTQVADKLVYGGDMVVKTKEQKGAYHQNSQHWRYEDFDIIVMAAGTNDYLDDAPLGELNSSNIHTFSGALNTIFGYLEDANEKRIAMGKAPFKIVMADLFYSDRTKNYAQRNNRFITKNTINLTLTDYQQRLFELADKYRSRGLDIYRWETIEYVNEDTCPYRATDNLHFTKTTYGLIGYGLTQFILENGLLD